MEDSRYNDKEREGLVIRWAGWAIAALFKRKVWLVAENLCLRQQLLVLQSRNP
jgi:hypothetical protein